MFESTKSGNISGSRVKALGKLGSLHLCPEAYYDICCTKAKKKFAAEYVIRHGAWVRKTSNVLVESNEKNKQN